MKLTYNPKSKDPIYYAQKSVRINGKVTTVTIERIGKHSELLLITDDPLAFAKNRVAELSAAEKNELHLKNVTIDFSKKLSHADNDLVSKSTGENIGYFYLQDIIYQLGLSSFCRDMADKTQITFDPYDSLRFLVYDRILDPGSKRKTWDNLGWYYHAPDIGYQHILRTMDMLYDHYDDYLQYLYQASQKIVPRDMTCCYYDCTNYFTEAECQDDEEYVDEVTGEVFKGLRQYGVSKEHRPNPIVEMGLLMDHQGIPISMCIHPGNTSEQTTAIPLEEKVLKMLRNKDIIYIADGGLGSYNIRQFNALGGRHFIVTQSIRKMSDVMKQSVFNDCDYRLLHGNTPVSVEMMHTFDRENPANLYLYEDMAYKIIYADQPLDLGFQEEYTTQTGKKKARKARGNLKQCIIVTFSRKMMEYQRWVRKRQIDRAENRLRSLDPDTYRKGPNDVTRFIRRTAKPGWE